MEFNDQENQQYQGRPFGGTIGGEFDPDRYTIADKSEHEGNRGTNALSGQIKEREARAA